MITITFLAEHNCLSSAISGTVDAFSIANLLWHIIDEKQTDALFTTRIASVDGASVIANGGIILQPDTSISDVHETDIIIVPAFLLPIDLDSIGTKKICSWLKEHHAKGTRIASTCTGTFLLAHAGLLDGKIATTNWQFARYFKKQFPKVELRIDRIFTEDSGIYCTGAATAFMDLCLHFIEKFGSADLARRCSKSLLIDPDRTTQMPYVLYDFSKSHSDKEILKSQQWMEKNYSEKFSIETVAEKAGISPRHFKRRFKKATGDSPLTYLQLLRIENAKQNLETTLDTINEITWQVGYEDVNSFRRLFKRHTGMSPKDYRKKFSYQPIVKI